MESGPLEAGLLLLPFLLRAHDVDLEQIDNIDVSHSYIALLKDKDGRPLGECVHRVLKQCFNAAYSRVLPCLHGMAHCIELKPVAYQRVPDAAFRHWLQHSSKEQGGRAHNRRFAAHLAAMQERNTLLQTMQSQGVAMVQVLVRLLPSFFYTPTTGVESGLAELGCAQGAQPMQLLQHILQPFPQPSYQAQQLQERQQLEVVVVEDTDGEMEAEQPAASEEEAEGHAAEGEVVALPGVDPALVRHGQDHTHTGALGEASPGLLLGDSSSTPGDDGGDAEAEWMARDRVTQGGHLVHDEVFEIVRPRGWDTQLPDPPGLKCRLYRYQQRALCWMVWRESHAAPHGPHAASLSSEDDLTQGGGQKVLSTAPVRTCRSSGQEQEVGVAGSKHACANGGTPGKGPADAAAYQQLVAAAAAPLHWPMDGRMRLIWVPVKLPVSGHVVWVNKEEGLTARTLPPNTLAPLKGGMLCDEMGLGKTVEVIALILARPRPLAPLPPPTEQQQGQSQKEQRQDEGKAMKAKGKRSWYAATGEESEADEVQEVEAPPRVLVPGGTLIIAPPTILQQWAGEIRRHSDLKVEVYEGLMMHTRTLQANYKLEARAADKEAKRLQKKLVQLEQQQVNALAEARPEGDAKGRKKAKRNKKANEGGSSSREDGSEDEADKQEAAVAAAQAATAAATAAHRAAEHVNARQVAEHQTGVLSSCDVVLTTYAVLSEEVNYVIKESERQLRRPKRYPMPDSPLIQVAWHRLVLDEAQMVGTGLTSVAVMSNRLHATHRWCVTGTPLGAGGLQDIFGAICALQYKPLDDLGTFKRLVVQPYLSGSQDGYHRLQLLLKPIMWRNSKAIAAADVTLPPRTLHNALLAMSGPERTFYQHVVAEARKANDAWKAHKSSDALAQEHSSPHEHRKKAGQGDLLARKAAQQLLQLRLACVHPQLTDYWRQLSQQLQLGQGQAGVLSVTEMLGRMGDQAQLELQNQEREYCQAADVLAVKLLKQADRLAPVQHEDGAGPSSKPTSTRKGKKTPSKKRGGAAGPAAAPPQPEAEDLRPDRLADDGHILEDVPDEPGPAGGQSPEERARGLREEALGLLESSYRVGEKGIGAVTGAEADGQHDAFQELDDITASNASWRAWRLVQVHTCHVLAGRYRELGRLQEAEQLAHELQHKQEELKENVEVAIKKAESQLEAAQQRAAVIQSPQLPDMWQEVFEQGFPRDFLQAQPQEWLTATHDKWLRAREVEAEKRTTVVARADAQQGFTVLLGTEVSHLLSSEESALQPVLRQVEALLGSQLCWAAYERLRAAVQAVEIHMRHTLQQQPPGTMASTSARSLPAERVQPVGSALWAASLPANTRLPWHCAVLLTSAAHSSRHVTSLIQGWLVPGADAVGLTMVRRAVNLAANKLRERAHAFDDALDAATRAKLLGCNTSLLAQAQDALKLQVELLRLWREVHVEALKVEVETSNRDLIQEEITAAMEGEGIGPKYGRMSAQQLRTKCDVLRKECEELRARKTYLEHQLAESAGGGGSSRGTLQEQEQEPAHDSQARATPAAALPRVGDAQAGAATPVAGLAQPARSTCGRCGTHCCGTGIAAALSGVLRCSSRRAAASSIHSTHGPATAAAQPQAAGSAHAGPLQASVKSVPVAAESHANGSKQQEPGENGMTHKRGHAPVIDLTAGDDDGSGGPGLQPPPAKRARVTARQSAPQLQPQQEGSHLAVEEVPPTKKPGSPGGTIHRHDGAGPSGVAQGVGGGAGAGWQQHHLLQEGELALQGGDITLSTGVECHICYNTLDEGEPLMVYACGHYLCQECNGRILSDQRPRCPTCRREVARNQVFRVVASRHSANASRYNPEVNPPEGKRLLTVKVLGSWMVKIDALIRRILLLRSTAPDEKHLVFSHFPAALELVSKALQVNGVGHVAVGLRGAKARDAVARFNSDPSLQVFLLSLHHGAAGLTLVRANHVFMLDISTDPAIEQQAVARVHRIGQQRPTTVTRLLCDGTVEMQILEALQAKQQVFLEHHTHHHVEGEEEPGDYAHMEEDPQLQSHTPQPQGAAPMDTDMDVDGSGAPAQPTQHSAGPSGAGGSHAHAGGHGRPGLPSEVVQEDPESALLASAALGAKETVALEEAAQLLSML